MILESFSVQYFCILPHLEGSEKLQGSPQRRLLGPGFKSIERLLVGLAATLDVHSVALNFSPGVLLSTKTISWLDRLQLTRTVSRKRNQQKLKNKVSTIRNFPSLDFHELGCCFHFGRWCCLCAAFYGPSGTSLMESVMLRSEGLVQCI